MVTAFLVKLLVNTYTYSKEMDQGFYYRLFLRDRGEKWTAGLFTEKMLTLSEKKNQYLKKFVHV